jgi:hypothetical protein
MRLTLLVLAVLIVRSDLRAQDAAPADTFAVDWTMDVDALDPPPQGAFVAICPPGGATQGSIWGTDTYTDDSSICLAAVHAGELTLTAGGAVLVEIAPGLAEYVGTTRNGIASSSYPAWDASFRFPMAPSALTTPAIVEHEYHGDWYTQPRQVKAPVGARVRFECSAGGTGGNVWGTDIYTDDSSICEAAVHAGLIKRANGGVVHFEMLGAQPSFTGSQRNGVSSMRYPGWPGSFRFFTIEKAPTPQP